MKELSIIIQNATKSIEDSYFHFRIDGGDPVYRERVYCYELYHQMRLCWPSKCEYYLNGEVDKSAHPILEKLGANQAKPDLLVHKPGYMSGNHAIIEVKKSDARRDGIRKDIKKLDLFRREVKYQRAIYLFFGPSANESLLERIQKIADDFDELMPIEIWLHQTVGKAAKHTYSIHRTSNREV